MPGARWPLQSFWFPLLTFAALALASVPFSAGGRLSSAASGLLGVLGGMSADSSRVALFWLVAIPAGYALTACYYLLRERRLRLVSPWRGLVVSGLGLFAVTAVTLSDAFPRLHGAVLQVVPGDRVVRGLLPFLAMAIGFATLAVTQRSLEFGVFAAVFLAAAITANLYDLVNLASRLGLAVHGPGVNNAVLSTVLLAGAVYFDARARRRWRDVGIGT